MEESAKVNTILKCFVDMNLETNEMFPYDVQILSVSFITAYYTVDEANTVSVIVSLNSPSTTGAEEADIVLSHVSTTDGDVDVAGFPVHVRWEIGEQEKVIIVPALRDFLEESDEELILGITNMVNLLPGPLVQSNVMILDTTELRSVSIIEASTNTRPLVNSNDSIVVVDSVTSSRPNASVFTSSVVNSSAALQSYLVVEGEQVNITVSLDQPSQYGVEKVDVSIINGMSNFDLDPTSFVVLNSARLEWAIGEQIKTLTINASLNNLLDGTRRIILELTNPDSVKFLPESIRRVQILIQDPPIARRFTTIDFGRIFKQRGSVLSGYDPNHTEQELYLMSIADGQTTTTFSLYWLVEMGTIYTDQQNTAGISESLNYADWPTYYFGVDSIGNDSGVVLKVTNQGAGEITYNGSIIPAGSTFNILLGRDATTITLPTNNGLQPAGSTLASDNITLEDDTFVESKYKFELYASIPEFNIVGTSQTSGPHGFQLKTFSDEPNTYFIGEFTLSGHSTTAQATNNALALFSSYSNMRTRFDTTTCTTTFMGPNKVHNVRMHGLILLSQNSLASDYMTHEIGLRDDFTPICGASTGNLNNLPWISIPFEIL
jgi:hypothetical protein